MKIICLFALLLSFDSKSGAQDFTQLFRYKTEISYSTYDTSTKYEAYDTKGRLKQTVTGDSSLHVYQYDDSLLIYELELLPSDSMSIDGKQQFPKFYTDTTKRFYRYKFSDQGKRMYRFDSIITFRAKRPLTCIVNEIEGLDYSREWHSFLSTKLTLLDKQGRKIYEATSSGDTTSWSFGLNGYSEMKSNYEISKIYKGGDSIVRYYQYRPDEEPMVDTISSTKKIDKQGRLLEEVETTRKSYRKDWVQKITTYNYSPRAVRIEICYNAVNEDGSSTVLKTLIEYTNENPKPKLLPN